LIGAAGARAINQKNEKKKEGGRRGERDQMSEKKNPGKALRGLRLRRHGIRPR